MLELYDNPEELMFPEGEQDCYISTGSNGDDKVPTNIGGDDKVPIKRIIADKVPIISQESANKLADIIIYLGNHPNSKSNSIVQLLGVGETSSVKAYGRDFLGRFILDVITNCDEIRLHSCSVNWNIKSLGNLLALRLTVWLRDLVSTSYSIARSKSSITRCPRMMYMRSWIFCNSSIVVLLLPLQD